MLAGGDPATLSLRDYLNAGFALAVEAHVRTGADVITATNRIEATMGLAELEEPELSDNGNVSSASDNDAALAELQKMMSGL